MQRKKERWMKPTANYPERKKIYIWDRSICCVSTGAKHKNIYVPTDRGCNVRRVEHLVGAYSRTHYNFSFSSSFAGLMRSVAEEPPEREHASAATRKMMERAESMSVKKGTPFTFSILQAIRKRGKCLYFSTIQRVIIES